TKENKIRIGDSIPVSDRLSMVISTDGPDLRAPESIGVYVLGANDDAIWWQHRFENGGGKMPLMGTAFDSIFTYAPATGRLIVMESRKYDIRWFKDGKT